MEMDEITRIRLGLDKQNISLGKRIMYETKAKMSRAKHVLKDFFDVLTGVHLKDNPMYEGAPRVSQEEVEKTPYKWIIPECIPACVLLWGKNIYTFMCSDRLDKNAWIEFRIDDLSDENKQILEEIKKKYRTYSYHEGCINIEVDGMGMNALNELVGMTYYFKMQDVVSKEAIITEEDLLIESGCYNLVRNPKYISLEDQLKDCKDMLSLYSLLIEDEYIKVLAPEKITKSIDEYIEEYGAVRDPETNIIYRSNFHYNKHLRYLESLNKDSFSIK